MKLKRHNSAFNRKSINVDVVLINSYYLKVILRFKLSLLFFTEIDCKVTIITLFQVGSARKFVHQSVEKILLYEGFADYTRPNI